MNYAKVPTSRTARTLWAGLLLAAMVLPVTSGAQPTSEDPTAPSALEVQIDLSVRKGRATTDGLEKAGLLAYWSGRFEDAEQAFVQAIRVSEERSERSRLGELWSNLAWLYFETGRDLMADSLMRRALEIDRESFGAGTPPVAHRTEELGRLYHARGRYREAGALLRRALGFYERDPKQYASEIALTQHQIGLNYWAMGDLNRAEVFIKKALARLYADDGADPRYRAAALLDLAELHHAASHDAEAREAFVRALREEDEIRRSTGLTNGAVFNSHSVLLRRLFSDPGSARTARSPRMATVSTGRR